MLGLPSEEFSSDSKGDTDQESGKPDPEETNSTDWVGLSPSSNRRMDARRSLTSKLELGENFLKEEGIEEEVVFEEATERSISIRQQDHSSSTSEIYLSQSNSNASIDSSSGGSTVSTKNEKTGEQDELTKEKEEKSPVSTKIDTVFDNRDAPVASGDVKSEKTEEQHELTKEKEKNSSGKKIPKVGGSGQLSRGETLLLALDREYQMSLLAAQYYRSRHFWYMFFPSVTITMISAIFAFAVQCELPISQDTKYMIAFFVGCSSIVNLFLQNVSNELNYDHCYKSQRTLGLGLKFLRCKVEYLNSTEEGISSKQIHAIENTMETIMEQNDAQIPFQIFIAYDLVANRLSLRMFPPVRFDESDPYEHNKISWAGMMEIVHGELFNVFSNHRAGGCFGYCCCCLTWPLALPDPERMVNLSIERVLEVLADESNKDLSTQLLERQEAIHVCNLEHAVAQQQTLLSTQV